MSAFTLLLYKIISIFNILTYCDCLVIHKLRLSFDFECHPTYSLYIDQQPPEPPDLPEMTETPSVPTERCAVCQRDYESGEQRVSETR